MFPGVDEPPMQSFCRSTTVPVAIDWREEIFKKQKDKLAVNDLEDKKGLTLIMT
ncbi:MULTISPECIES: hypothetical protein [unclassified Mammaliicoccus]|uniref:hypothetical protein n=1 Tax=unclassified Mammaliicoccus TaxID=2803851 RepID=UPI001EFB5302|nr:MULTISPECIES: hypothetical protein [unclassified Mammaliicoccus]